MLRGDWPDGREPVDADEREALTCQAESPDSMWGCTRQQEHGGDHVAAGNDGRIYARWAPGENP